MDNLLYIFITGISAIQWLSFPGFEDTFQNLRADALNHISQLRNEVLWLLMLFSQ
jgi:hypothetical protein